MQPAGHIRTRKQVSCVSRIKHTHFIPFPEDTFSPTPVAVLHLPFKS